MCDSVALILKLCFDVGKCNHDRRCDSIIQRMLTGQHQLYGTSSRIWCQTPAGVMSSFSYT